jgi:hypothetical protein
MAGSLMGHEVPDFVDVDEDQPVRIREKSNTEWVMTRSGYWGMAWVTGSVAVKWVKAGRHASRFESTNKPVGICAYFGWDYIIEPFDHLSDTLELGGAL